MVVAGWGNTGWPTSALLPSYTYEIGRPGPTGAKDLYSIPGVGSEPVVSGLVWRPFRGILGGLQLTEQEQPGFQPMPLDGPRRHTQHL
jgi:hypothetical protein